MTEHHISHIDFIDRQLNRRVFGHLIDQGQSAKSIARFISTIRSFHQFAIRKICGERSNGIIRFTKI